MMIKVASLTKRYGEIEALRRVEFDVASGDIVGLLGPNGAGKSTTIRCLTGFFHPDEGEITVDGLNVLERPSEVQARVGYLPENTPLYSDMTVQGYLRMIADLRGVPESEKLALISGAVFATGLAQRLTQSIGQLSKGFRQRVGIAQAILHRPRLLILDEPTIGLDPTQVVEIRNLIKSLASHSTILFSSHILSEVEAVCDRVIILINGEVVPLRTSEGYAEFRVVGESKFDLCPAVFDVVRREGWSLRELRRDVRTLETVFTELVNST